MIFGNLKSHPPILARRTCSNSSSEIEKISEEKLSDLKEDYLDIKNKSYNKNYKPSKKTKETYWKIRKQLIDNNIYIYL